MPQAANLVSIPTLSQKNVYGYVYKVINILNNKIYVGQKKSTTFLTKYLGSGTLITKAVQKYGKNNFTVTVLQWCYSKEELNSAEIYWIDKLNARDLDIGYNIAKGGDVVGIPHSEETKKKIRMAQLGEKNHMYGKHWKMSEEGKEKIRKAQTGISNSMYGKHLTIEHRQKISDWLLKNSPMRGKHHSDQTKKKISESKKGTNTKEQNPFYGKHHSKEAKQKISDANKGRVPPNKGKKMSHEVYHKYKEAIKNRMYHKTCLSCGKEFLSKGSRTRWCTDCNTLINEGMKSNANSIIT